MADFNVNHITGKQGQQGTVLAGVTTVSSTGSMRIPSGPTEQRGGRGRMVFGGGYYPSPHANLGTMDFVEIATLGNAVDFGDYTQARYAFNMGSSGTRGLFAAGNFPSSGLAPNGSTAIDYITFQSGGGASDFGELTQLPTYKAAGFGNGIRGVFSGGYDGASPYSSFKTTQYVTIATTGDSSFFGELSIGSRSDMAVADTTRGCVGGLDIGSNPSTTVTNTIEYFTTATTGNSQDFGDLTIARTDSNGCSSSITRGLFYSGSPGPGAHKNTIDYITIQTKGNAINFGDMTTSGNGGGSAHGSNLTRSVNHDSGAGNVIEYVTIATTGNGQDFGDLTRSSNCNGGVDNSNGSIA